MDDISREDLSGNQNVSEQHAHSESDNEGNIQPAATTMGSESLSGINAKNPFRRASHGKKTRIFVVSGRLSLNEATTINLPIVSWRNSTNDFCLIRLKIQIRDTTIEKRTGWQYFYPLKIHTKWEDISLKLPNIFELEKEIFRDIRETEVTTQILPPVLKEEAPRNVAPKSPGDAIGVAILTELSNGKSLDSIFLLWWNSGRLNDANYLLLNMHLYAHAEKLFSK